MRSILILSATTLTLMAVASPDPFHGQLVRSANASIRVCEVWRDYYYNVETDEFIEWAGEPYVSDVCYTIGRGDRRPPNTRTDDPKPGVGRGVSARTAEDVRKTRCKQCGMGFDGCMQSVKDSSTLCRKAHWTYANHQCVERARKGGRGGITAGGYNFYELLMGKSKLPGYSQKDWEWGWKRDKTLPRGAPMIPSGPGFYNCQQSYAKNHPSWGLNDTLSASVTATFNMPPFGVGGTLGGTETTTTSWGGVTGYESACSNAASTANAACTTAASQCQQRYSCSLEEMGISPRVTDNQPVRHVAVGGFAR